LVVDRPVHIDCMIRLAKCIWNKESCNKAWYTITVKLRK
jgi:hypothetical protein